MAEGIRLDKYLWFTRLTKTRSLAQEVAAQGRLRIDRRNIDKPHHIVHVGEVVSFTLHGRVRVIRVEAIPARRGRAPEAQRCYRDLSVAQSQPMLTCAAPGS